MKTIQSKFGIESHLAWFFSQTLSFVFILPTNYLSIFFYTFYEDFAVLSTIMKLPCFCIVKVKILEQYFSIWHFQDLIQKKNVRERRESIRRQSVYGEDVRRSSITGEGKDISCGNGITDWWKHCFEFQQEVLVQTDTA